MWYHISEDLVVEIFTRLPPKSLIRFRLVSKSICSRVTTPDFIRLNKIRSCRIPEKLLLTHRIHHEEGGRTFYEDFYTLHSKSQLSLSPDHGYDGITPIKFPFPFKSSARAVGSCNGIMLVLDKRNSVFWLWNPSIRRKLTLPDYPLRNAHIFATGFAFDRVTEDYKIFTLSFNEYDYRIYSFVYTMKTGTWCRISTPVTPTYKTRKGHLINIYEAFKEDLINHYRNSQGHLVNGVLHWSVLLTDDDRRSANIHRYILTFDVGTHVFGTIELPRQKYSEITTIDGSLAVITYKFVTNKDCYAKIWVRKEHNTRPKWVAYFSCRVDSQASIMPLSRKGNLLFKYVFDGIEVYNDWTRERSQLVDFNDSSYIKDVSWFVESLELLDTGSPYDENIELLDAGYPYEDRLIELLDTSPPFEDNLELSDLGSPYEESEASDLETEEL